MLDRDLARIAAVADRAVLRRLLRAIAATSAGELNSERLGASLGSPATTVRCYVELLELMFLVRRVPVWSNNLLARTIKRPKIHVADTGLPAYLVGADERRIESDPNLAGAWFETFVAMELRRQISWQDDRPELFHFRDRDQREVDVVIERRDGSVTAVEVKAAATVPFGDRLAAVPLSGLWSC